MAEDKRPDPEKDTSKPGREEEIIDNRSEADKAGNNASKPTQFHPADKSGKNETEGERRFKEGMANNNDTDE